MTSTFSLSQVPETKKQNPDTCNGIYSFIVHEIKRKPTVIMLFWSYNVFANIALWTHLTDVHLLQRSRHVACNPVVPF